MGANQGAPVFNKGVASNFCWLRCSGQVKFIQPVMYTKKPVLFKNISTWAKHSVFNYKNTHPCVETH